MKKLRKMELKEFHEMTDFEMKNVLGGYEDAKRGCDAYTCSGTCKVAHGSEYDPHPYLYDGTCGWTLYPFVKCTCAAGFLG